MSSFQRLCRFNLKAGKAAALALRPHMVKGHTCPTEREEKKGKRKKMRRKKREERKRKETKRISGFSCQRIK